MKQILLVIGGVLLYTSPAVWMAWVAYNIIALSAPFWTTVGLGVLGWIVQVFVAILLSVIATFSLPK